MIQTIWKKISMKELRLGPKKKKKNWRRSSKEQKKDLLLRPVVNHTCHQLSWQTWWWLGAAHPQRWCLLTPEWSTTSLTLSVIATTGKLWRWNSQMFLTLCFQRLVTHAGNSGRATSFSPSRSSMSSTKSLTVMQSFSTILSSTISGKISKEQRKGLSSRRFSSLCKWKTRSRL